MEKEKRYYSATFQNEALPTWPSYQPLPIIPPSSPAIPNTL